MKTSALSLACALLALPLAGLAQSAAYQGKGGPKAPSLICTGAVCTIAVNVSGCAISVDHPVVEVSKAKNVVIRWRIDAGGYAFAPKGGIFFKTPGHERQFFGCTRTQPDVWQCVDKNTQAGPFDYGIKVLKPDGSECPVLDPTIFNDP